MKTDGTLCTTLSASTAAAIPLWRQSIMPWRSGNNSVSNSADQQLPLSQQLQQEDADSTASDGLPRIDDDEQDYTCHDHPRYDDDEDEDDVDDLHRCVSAVGEPSIPGLPPSASHHHDDDLDDLSDLAQTQIQQHHPPSSAVSGMSPTNAQTDLPPSSAPYSVGGSLNAAAAAAAAAVVIEDGDDDDPGLDHSSPPDECAGALNPSAAWRPQSQQSTCEFTHTITHYSQKRESGCKKAEYSATTVDAYGNRWRLIVYVNGNGRASNHHLSLFLQVADADELPFGWKKAVSYVLTLEHPSGSSLGYAKRNPDKTFKLCPKAIDWGWSQFITSDRIQQEGYISNDSLTVRASVTVKSSSVSIDPEDAELYLKCAVEEGNAEAVKACLAQGAGVNCQFKDDLYTPLHTACSSSTSTGSLEVLKLLLQRGADGNACNKWRETPLLIAANNGHRAAVEALLESGADPSLCSEAGWSALTFAAHKGYDDIVALLLAAGAPVNCRVTEDLSTPLHKACAGGKPGHLSAVRQLIDGGADVHALNKWRETPLLTAANHGQAAAVEALLRAGGDPCKCTDTGWSPLSIAAYKGHDDVVRLLLEEGAPTEEADPTLSALLQAATKGLPETVELLLRHGADHTVTTKKGDTALSILVEQNLIDAAVEMVTEYNASVPRCSRDRKKVQRARLLINLRVKQQQREGLLNGKMGSDDDDSDQDDSDNGVNSALHDSSGIPKAAAPGLSKGKKKTKMKAHKSIEAAEAEAKAAEEALLLELEQEETKAQKEEAAASTKRSKKKKKREREKLQKLKEEEQRQKAEKEKEELEMKQRMKDEKERKEREQRDREKREREMKEAAEREEKVAAKRREKEERERRQREQEKKDRERSVRLEKKATEANAAQLAGATSSSPHNKKERPSSKGKGTKKSQHSETQKIDDKGNSRKTSVTSTLGAKSPALKKRGWETKTVSTSVSNAQRKPHTQGKAQAKEHATASATVPPAHGGAPRSVRVPTPSRRATSPPVTGPTSAPVPIPVSVSTATTTPSSSPLQTMEDEKRQPQVVAPTEPVDSHQSSETFSVEDQLEDMANGVMDFLGFDSAPNVGGQTEQPILNNPAAKDELSPTAAHQEDASHNDTKLSVSEHLPDEISVQYNPAFVELPSVSVFQQKQVTELMHRCALARSSASSPQADPLGMISEDTIKTVVYRWIVRASHESSSSLDPIIPSWTENERLTEFFQRQFISESRRGAAATRNGGLVSIEVLKEAGSRMSVLCQSLAKDLVQYRTNCKQQTPNDWTDVTMNVTATEMMNNDGSSVVVIDWARRSQSYVSSGVFSSLRNRYRGIPNRFLSAVFAVSKRYEAKRMIISGTSMDFRLPPSTLSTLAREAHVNMELWVEPLTVFGNNAFCGVFPDVDLVFGGLQPFGKEEGGGEDILLQHGGSVALMPPLDSSTASVYVRNILNLLDKGVPLSFALILPTDCFRESATAPTISDLPQLDPRLGHGMYIRSVEILPAGQHTFQNGDGEGISSVSQTGSLFLLIQNDAGSARFPVNESSLSNIIYSMGVNYMAGGEMPSPVPAPVGYVDYPQEQTMAFAAPPTASSTEFSGFSGTGVHSNFRNDQPNRPVGRSRIFDLVDDGDDDNGNDVDVSGMLNTLNVSMFQGNSAQDVDIEAISLMGIGGSSLNGSVHQGTGRFG